MQWTTAFRCTRSLTEEAKRLPMSIAVLCRAIASRASATQRQIQRGVLTCGRLTSKSLTAMFARTRASLGTSLVTSCHILVTEQVRNASSCVQAPRAFGRRRSNRTFFGADSSPPASLSSSTPSSPTGFGTTACMIKCMHACTVSRVT